MNILLINTNPVVSRLISLCIRDDNTLLEEVTEVTAVKGEHYDLVFVDDLSYVGEVEKFLTTLQAGVKVLLLGNNSIDDLFESFDEILRKPFLPSQIRNIIDTLENKDTPFIFPLSTETEESAPEDDNKSKILNLDDISQIKSLLEEDTSEEEVIVPEEEYETRKREVITEHLEADGLEIVSEDEIINILSGKVADKKKKKAKKKSKKVKKLKKEQEETYSFEEALIAAIEGMKVKKIKKLLKNADIKISIHFKDKK
jgi:uncharacterized protein YajQ (UPF0234 family)